MIILLALITKITWLNKGTNVITALQNGKPLTGQDSLYVSAVISKKTNEIIIKVVKASGKEQDRHSGLKVEKLFLQKLL